MEENENLEEEEDDDVDEFPDLAVSQTQQSQLPDHLLDDINRNEEQIEERNDATDHQIEGKERIEIAHSDHTEARCDIDRYWGWIMNNDIIYPTVCRNAISNIEC